MVERSRTPVIARLPLCVGFVCTSGGFPIPSSDISERVADVEACVRAGATEIDIVLEPGQAPDVSQAHITAIKAACGTRPLKVNIATMSCICGRAFALRRTSLRRFECADFCLSRRFGHESKRNSEHPNALILHS